MSIEAMKLARQLLWRYRHETPIGNQPYMICQEVDEAFEIIDEAIEQAQKQEPVAWLNRDSVDGLWYPNAFKTDNLEPSIPLYTSPPQRQSVDNESDNG